MSSFGALYSCLDNKLCNSARPRCGINNDRKIFVRGNFDHFFVYLCEAVNRRLNMLIKN